MLLSYTDTYIGIGGTEKAQQLYHAGEWESLWSVLASCNLPAGLVSGSCPR